MSVSNLQLAAALFSAIREDLEGTFEHGDGSFVESAYIRAGRGLKDANAGFDADSSVADALESLKGRGLTYADCVRAFAVSNDDPYVKKARELVIGDDDVSIDDLTVTAAGDDGAWVKSWIWIGNEEAGVLNNSALLECVLDHAQLYLEGSPYLEAEIRALREAQAGWLEELISNFSDKLDEIETEIVTNLPGSIRWVDEDGQTFQFMPSDALFQLLHMARMDGLPDDCANRANEFCMRYGNKLDAVLTVYQTA
jgi:hypothetical protein